ncbi:hypothetical protein AB0G74_22325 [Streptomyces sp. NPDC020875]|uniref:hypothetical protein n=1 Tax=Streptomyces sp. NPDC020875 TaxID=3154898 RepID=UPI0033D87474
MTAISGLSLDPRLVTDLLGAPEAVREHALARLPELTTGTAPGGVRLPGGLSGLRELPLGDDAQWGLVYIQRPAPAASAHRTEVHVVAVRPAGPRLHDTARARLGRTRPLGAMAHASRTRSPQLPPGHRATPARPPLSRPALPLSPPTPRGPVL